MPNHFNFFPTKFSIFLLFALLSINFQPILAQTSVFINELHYDNAGTDANEAIEIAGPAGTDVTGWSIVRYNGSDGTVYTSPSANPSGTDVLSGTIPDLCNGYGVMVVYYQTNGLQNGAPDGIALVDNSNQVIQFLSYEGTFTATDGPASGMTSIDIGFSESSSTAVGFSLQLSGTGIYYEDFSWNEAAANTFGSCNTGQTFYVESVKEIFEIQGTGMSSPYAGKSITTENNVVTAVGPDGFFVQTPTARTDGNPETSDGIFVYTGSAPAVVIGDHVNVTGEVIEFHEMTEFSNGPTVTLVSAGNPLPTAIQFDENTPAPDQPQSETELERYEGMLIELSIGTATAPTDEYGNTPIVARATRTFREPGIEYPGEPDLPVWDGNPEIFEIDPDRLGLENRGMFAGTQFEATGVLGFSFGDYQLWPTSLTITHTPTIPQAVRPRADGEVMIGSLNLFQLFRNQPNPSEYQDRLSKFSLYIRNLMRAPEILAVQEVENINTLHDLADKMKSDDPAADYTSYLIEGNDESGIDVGFLIRTTMQVNSVEQLGKDEIFTYDGTLLHDRPPLLLEAEFPGGQFPVKVMNLHLRSMLGIADPGDGERVRQKRHEQATSVSLMVQDIQANNPHVNLVVIGDFNAFEFTDGYVDVLGQIMGTPSDATQAMIPGTDEVDPDLTNRIFSLSPAERYSYNSGANAQTLDHILTSQTFSSAFVDLQYARANSDVPTSYESNPSTSLRCSDHDGVVLYLNVDNLIAVELVSFSAENSTEGVFLHWTTATETENFGFHIFRSLSEDADYIKLTSDLIAGSGSSNQSHSYSYLDRQVKTGTTYYYKLAEVDYNGEMTFHGPIMVRIENLPTENRLEQNYPNPFNPETTINYALKESGKVSLRIYNLRGQLVRTLVDTEKSVGNYSAKWNGINEKGVIVSTGVYISVLKINDFEQIKKLILIR